MEKDVFGLLASAAVRLKLPLHHYRVNVRWGEASNNPSGVTVRSQPTPQASKTSVKQTKGGIQCMLNVNTQQQRFIPDLKTNGLHFYSELIPTKNNVIREAISVYCPRKKVFTR